MTGVEMSSETGRLRRAWLRRGISLAARPRQAIRRRRTTIFSAVQDRSDRSSFLRQSWRPYITGDISVYPVDCTPNEMLTAESVSIYGDQLKLEVKRSQV
jgi:hypothetical protein